MTQTRIPDVLVAAAALSACATLWAGCSGPGGGGGGLLSVDCVDPPGAGNTNPNLDPLDGNPRCGPSIGEQTPGNIGDGPPLDIDGSSVRVHHGFVDAEGNRLVLVVDAIYIHDGNGAIFGVDIDTGERSIISGTAHDPRTGAQMVGDGPLPGHFYDVQPGPDGWVALIDTGDIRSFHLMNIDPATGARTMPENDLADGEWPGCSTSALMDATAYPYWTAYVTGNGDAGPSLTVADDGTVFLPISAGPTCAGDNGDIEGIIAIHDGECRVVSLASHFQDRCTEIAVGSGPSFASMRTIRWHDGKIYAAQIDGSLMMIDAATGDREFVASDRVGTGVPIADAGQLAFGPDGTLWAILDARADGSGGFQIGTVDYASTGDRVTTPASLSNPYPSIYPHPSEPLVFAADDDVVWILDPASGNRNVFSY